MENLISSILANYVPVVIIASFIVSIFVVAIAGVIRNSGKLEDVARSNLMIKTVIVGMLMLFFSGAFVFSFHKIYVSKYYGNIQSDLSTKLSQIGNSSDTGQLQNQIGQTGTTTAQPQCTSIFLTPSDCIKQTISQVIATLISVPIMAAGWFVDTAIKYLNASFPFLFNLPSALFDGSGAISAGQVDNFMLLIKFSEIIS